MIQVPAAPQQTEAPFHVNIITASNCIYLLMHLFLDVNNAFRDVNIPINKRQMVTRRFEERDKKH